LNFNILHNDVQTYIEENLYGDINRILLRKSPFTDVSSRELAEQIDSKRRCEKKLPLWFSTPGIYYPPKLSIEQASSETTARFKSGVVTGKTLLDVTGGFGVDSYYFQKAGMKVTHSEINSELSDIVRHNAKVLGTPDITFYKGNGLNLLDSGKTFDTIFIDPSRRVAMQKVFQLKDCEPDVPGNIDKLLSASRRLVIKTSPLLDLQAGMKELKNITGIYVISIKNDCKELLWILDADATASEPEVICRIFNEEELEYRFKISEERSFHLNRFSEPQKFLYEPDVALLKAGCFKLICRDFGTDKLQLNSHLYTSETLNETFPGRKFRIMEWGEYKKFMKENKTGKANIISRNFPLSAPEIKKKHRIADGGDDFLIFTTGPAGQLLAIMCRKVSEQT
jgi:precorrin-6B methylase 2